MNNLNISATDFYQNYDGHLVPHLNIVKLGLTEQNKKNFVYLAGDSTLDNKYWFGDKIKAVNGYENIISRPTQAKPDVSHWINNAMVDRNMGEWACINTSVEATTLEQRKTALTEQDEFIRDNITENDVLVCSIGGNDIALAPTKKTIWEMMWLTRFAWRRNIESGSAGGLAHFKDMFGAQTQKYLEKLCSKKKPKKIIVGMVYYLDESSKVDSWANHSLAALGYDKDPSLLQSIIRTIFREATSKIKIEGVEVVPIPFFETLNGKNTEEYCQRVEPSPIGGKKLAEAIVDKM